MRTVVSRGLGACAALAAVVVATGGTAVGDEPHARDLAEARAATVKFHDVERAVADGRFELADLAGLTCIEDPGGAGGMGVHYVKGELVGDGEIDVTKPEALLYDPSGPHPRLLGVEYVVFVADWGEDRDPPMLFGHEFHLVEAGNRYGLPAFYELHAWIWHHNRAGCSRTGTPASTVEGPFRAVGAVGDADRPIQLLGSRPHAQLAEALFRGVLRDRLCATPCAGRRRSSLP